MAKVQTPDTQATQATDHKTGQHVVKKRGIFKVIDNKFSRTAQKQLAKTQQSFNQTQTLEARILAGHF